MDRTRLISARLQRYLAAGNDYVERAGHRPESWAGAKAQALRRQVMQRLGSSEAYRFVHQFAGFFTLLRLADVDPLEFVFSPPLTTREARTLLKRSATPGWCEDADVFASPADTTYKIKMAVIPRLSCLFYLLFETEGDLLLDFAEKPCAGFKDFSADFTRAMSSAMTHKKEEGDTSNHAYRSMLDLTNTLESVVGADFSVFHLCDDDVLNTWRQMAVRGTGRTRLTEFLRLLSALTAEIRSAHNEYHPGASIALDDAKSLWQPSLEDGQVAYGDDSHEVSLAHPFIVELLTEEEKALLQFLLVRTRDLAGLHLSRARAVAFSPLENRMIEAKRQKRDASTILEDPSESDGYELLLGDLEKISQRLDALSSAAVKVLWDNERRLEAMQCAVAAGLVDMGYVSGLLERSVGDVTGDETDEIRIDRMLSCSDRDPAFGHVLRDAGGSWKKLKRRLFFASIPDRLNGLEALAESAELSITLCRQLVRLQEQLRIAVEPHLSEDGFRSEATIVRKALWSIHIERANEETVQ